jgi:hypothetical protein
MKRAGEENQFACMNREVNINHIYSRKLPGQLAITGIALAAWNAKISLGMSLNFPQTPPPAQQPNPAIPVRPEEPLFPEVAAPAACCESTDQALAEAPASKRPPARSQAFCARLQAPPRPLPTHRTSPPTPRPLPPSETAEGRSVPPAPVFISNRDLKLLVIGDA